ncbi:PP2C family protein-serine/threonine phosphatase [Streptomyces polygonati]|uniref:PP2C family protein-serine/threonine phosphatase n=1 Tax=Streptomyces polygonati TaxID=1617087 RepID=A0ABV8HMW5_9ACTN
MAPVGWIAVLGGLAWWLPDGGDVVAGLAVAPAVTCAVGARRRWVLGSGLLALGMLGGELADGSPIDNGPLLGAAGTMLAVMTAGMCTAGRRSRMAAELDRTREIALAAQQVLLRPLPDRIGGWTVASTYLSASRGAHVGGDFYEVLATPFGVRALIGDARGHGLPAIGMVAALLGSFREAAHQEPDLIGVLHRLDGALHRHLRDRADDPATEEFATVQLLQLGEDGEFQAVNCGHPQPYLLGLCSYPLPLGDPLPPLGLLEDSGAAVPAGGRIATGEGLLLYTDGIQDARDRTGRFFPLPDIVIRATAPSPLSGPAVAAGLRTAVQRHTGGRLADDMAVLVLVREAALEAAPRAAELCSGASGR